MNNAKVYSQVPSKLISTKLLSMALLIAVALSTPAMAAKPTITNTDELITVEVDVDVCQTGDSICSDLGVGSISAEAGNDSPVLLVIQIITPFGDPLSGLVDSDFGVNTVRSINGLTMELPLCASCFIDAGNGIYYIALRQLGNWGNLAGTYMAQLEVDVTAAKTLYRLVSFEIP